jgi:hypothetical protein
VRTAVLATLALALASCAETEEAAFVYATLDCAQPFEAQSAKLTAQPLTPAPKDPAEPYRYYSSPDGRVSYLITEPSAPGHPAIMMQQAKGGDVVTTGCPYGDKAGYDQLHAYLDSLKTWRRTK